MARTKRVELNAETLRQTLWETLQAVKAGSLKVDQANSVASQSREICRITKLQLEALKLGGKVTKTEVKRLMI